MNKQTISFADIPEVADLDMVFSTVETNQKLRETASVTRAYSLKTFSVNGSLQK